MDTVLDVFEIANVVVDDVKRRFAADIAVVAYYGSYARGTADEWSDLDFFFIPSTEKGADASLQFVVDGIGFDFWPISWERAWRIASFDEPIVSVIAEAVVLWARSDPDQERFDALKGRIRELQQPSNRALMVSKAAKRLENGFVHLATMHVPDCRENLPGTRIAGVGVVEAVLQSLGLLNQVYFAGVDSKSLREAGRLTTKPERLAALLERITVATGCGEIRHACAELLQGTRNLIVSNMRNESTAPTYADACTGLYEEFVSSFNKLLRACESRDHATALLASAHVQSEVSRLLALVADGVEYPDATAYGEWRQAYGDAELPDLLDADASGDLSLLAERVRSLDERLRALLQSHGVTLRLFDTVAALQDHLLERR